MQAQHLAVGQVGDMALTDKGQQVMFAQRVKLDVLHDHHFVVIGRKDGVVDERVQIVLIPFAEILEGFGGALRPSW